MDHGVSNRLPHPDGWFGPKKSKPANLNLVEGSSAVPCEPRPFPFWLSSVIAAVALLLVAMMLRIWILPAIMVEPEFDAPVIGVTNAALERSEPDAVPPLRRPIRKVLPVAPRVKAPLAVPALQPQIVKAPLVPPAVEPYDPTESLEEAELPFPGPTTEPEKKPAELPPTPAPERTARPENKPRSNVPSRARGPSRPARVLRRYEPGYPESARRDKVEGRVVLDVQINSNGRVGSVRVLSSSGSPVLDSTAISAVKRWSFSPAREDGKPVSSQVHVPFRFSIR